MKGIFKSKPRTPVELVQQLRHLLLCLDNNAQTRDKKREDKMVELGKLMLEMRIVLFRNGQAEPNSEACAQLTQEFFKDNTFWLLILCFPKLDSGPHQSATHVVANLQRQRINGRIIASEHLEKNLDLVDILLPGYLNGDIANVWCNFEGCIRHQTVARHKSTAVEFLSANYNWFFEEYNSQLLQSSGYITGRQAVKFLGDMLLDRSNSAVMFKYVSSLQNMRILMNLFTESKKTVQVEIFHVFKLFVANQNKPADIIGVLVTSRDKLLRFLGDFTTDKEDEQFEADKAQVIREITSLEVGDRRIPTSESEKFEVES